MTVEVHEQAFTDEQRPDALVVSDCVERRGGVVHSEVDRHQGEGIEVGADAPEAPSFVRLGRRVVELVEVDA